MKTAKFKLHSSIWCISSAHKENRLAFDISQCHAPDAYYNSILLSYFSSVLVDAAYPRHLLIPILHISA